MDFPNYENGYATNPSEALYPHLWDKLVLCLEPSIGNQGARLWDFSGKGHHGVLASGPTYQGGRQGYAVDLDGTDDTVVVAHHDDFAANDQLISIMFWGLVDAFDDAPFIFKRIGATDFPRFGIVSDGGANTHFFASTSGTANDVDVAPANPSDGEWHHYCATMDTQFARLFIDGFESTAGAAATMGASTNDIVIGNAPGSTLYLDFLDWRFHDLRIYNRALSRQEIYDSFAGATPLLRNPYPLKQRGLVTVASTFNATLTLTGALTKLAAKTFAGTISLAGDLAQAISRFKVHPTHIHDEDIKYTHEHFEG